MINHSLKIIFAASVFAASLGCENHPQVAVPGAGTDTSAEGSVVGSKYGIKILVGDDRNELSIPPVGHWTPPSEQTSALEETAASEGRLGTIEQGVTVESADGGTTIDLNTIAPQFDPGWILSWGAAKQCYFEIEQEHEVLPGYASDLVEDPWSVFDDDGTDDVNWYHFFNQADIDDPPAFNNFFSCDELLFYQEVSLCIGDKLASVAEAVGPITWEGPGNDVGTNPLIYSNPANRKDYMYAWTIPPQSSENRFIARDLALYALAHVGRLELERPDGFDQDCSEAYINKFDPTYTADSQQIFGVNSITPPAYFPPEVSDATSGNRRRLAESRLKFKASILRAASRQLRELIEDSVYADLAGAEQARAAAGDPLAGAELFWGAKPRLRNEATPASFEFDVDGNSVSHALRTLFGRLELGSSSPWDGTAFALQVRRPRGDPKCAGTLATDLLLRVGNQDFYDESVAPFAPRWKDRAIRTPGQALAVTVVQESRVVLWPLVIDEMEENGEPGIETARTAIRDQLLLNAALQRGLTGSDEEINGVPFSDTPGGRAVVAALDQVEDGDLLFAIRKVGYAGALLTGGFDHAAPGRGIKYQETGVAPTVASFPNCTSCGVMEKGLPLGDLTVDIMAQAGGAQQAAQCLEHLENSVCVSCAQSDASAGLNGVFQSTFMLGDILRERLEYLARLARTEQGSTGNSSIIDSLEEVSQVAEKAGAETLTWTGPGRIFLSSPVTGPVVDEEMILYLAGFRDEDLGITPPGSDAELEEAVFLAYGPAWVADCLAGLRASCDDVDLEDYVVPVTDYDYHNGVNDLNWLHFNTDDVDASPEGGWGVAKNLYVILRSDPLRPGVGKVLAGLAPRFKAAPGNELFGAIHEVASDFRRDLANKVLGFDQRLAAKSHGLGDGDTTSSPGYCIEGVPRDFFVPLENELTSDSDQFEDSWKHYLDLARQAAVKTDEIGREIIRLGLDKDYRREAAGEQLANICGDFGALQEIEIVEGEVDAPEDDQNLTQCFDEPIHDVVFVTNDPYADLSDAEATSKIKQLYLGCVTQTMEPGPGASNELCDKEVLTHAGLDLAPFVEAGGVPTESCADLAIEAIGSVAANTGLDSSKLSSLALEKSLDPIGIANALAGIKVHVDNDMHWSVTRDNRVLMSTRAPPMGECGTPEDSTPCTLWPVCVFDDCSLDPIAERFANIFGTASAVGAVQQRDELLQRVTGALWLMGAMSGSLAEGTFNLPVPAVNFSGAHAPDSEYAPVIYGISTYQLSGDHYVLAGGRTTSYDTDILDTLTPVTFDFAQAARRNSGIPRRPSWVEEVYTAALGATQDGTYLHVMASSSPRTFPPIQLDKGVSDSQLGTWIQAFAAAARGSRYTATCGGAADSSEATRLYREAKYPDEVGQLCMTPNNAHPIMGSRHDINGWISDIFFYNVNKNERAHDIIPGWSSSTTKGRLRSNHEWAGDTGIGLLPPQETTCVHSRVNAFFPKILPECLGLYQLGSGGNGYTRFTEDALRPFDGCSPGDRAQLFVNSNTDVTVCERAQELGRALALSCVLGGEYRALKLDDPLPALVEPKDLQKFEDWLGYQQIKTRVLVGQLALQSLPERVVDDIVRATVGTGAIKGEHGDLILQLENNIRLLAKLLNSMELDFGQLQQSVNTARIGLKGAELEKDAALAQLAIQRFQLYSDMAQAAAQATKGVLGMITGAGAEGGGIPFAGGAADAAAGAATIGFGFAQMSALGDLEDIADSQAANNVAGVMNEMQRTVGPVYTDMKNIVEDLRIGVSQILSVSSALKQKQNQAKYEAAKGSGADFVTIDGEDVLFPVNTVLNRQYDIAARRYKESLNNTKRLAYFARLAIEQRIGQRMDEMDEEVGALEAPATWANDICNFQGVNYEELRAVDTDEEGNVVDTKLAEEFADPYVGDYVDDLEAFVEYYNIDFPSHEGDDTAVLSLRDDLIGTSGACPTESKNLLYFSHALTSGQVSSEAEIEPVDATVDPVAEVPAEAIQGWQLNACATGEDWCLIASSGATLVDALGAPQLAPSVSPVGGVSWLHDEPVGDLPEPVEGPAPPPRSVYQRVSLKGGARYALSWWDMARSFTGEPTVVGTIPEYSAAVYTSTWELVATRIELPHYHVDPVNPDPDGGIWGPRRELIFTAPTEGSFYVVFTAGLPGLRGSVAIANVQLEEAGISDAATSYEATDATRQVLIGQCIQESADAFRDLFDYKCIDNECFYELRSPFLIDADDLAQGESRLSGKLARGNFNFRHMNVALNIVGTGVLDCSSVGVESCYGSGYTEYTLDHDAFATPVIDYLGAAREFNFGSATIQRGKALTTERYITLPIGSADQELLQQPQTQKPEYSGRPLSGSYRFRIYDNPALVWEQVEDVQFVLNYRYWSRVQRESSTN